MTLSGSGGMVALEGGAQNSLKLPMLLWLQRKGLQVSAGKTFIGTLKFVINTVSCNTESDTQWSLRGPGMSTSGFFTRKRKQNKVELSLHFHTHKKLDATLWLGST